MSHAIVKLTQAEVVQLLSVLEARLHLDKPQIYSEVLRVYGVPRGGTPVAFGLRTCCEIVNDPAKADFIVDDIVDSGRTREKFQKQFPGKPFYALVDKTDTECPSGLKAAWIVFPWEGTEEGSSEDIFIRLLQYIGEDPKRGGLLETPGRMAKAWKQWTSGYGQEPANVLKVFSDGAENYDEMILVKDIPFYSLCEHHLAPFFGAATVAYIPDKKIVGLSKLARVTDIFARRLQVQERMTSQIATAVQEALQPKGVGVLVRARHLCMESRGICKQGHHTETSSLLGVFRQGAAREEFLHLART